jgi:trimeric autotransporter adhesin
MKLKITTIAVLAMLLSTQFLSAQNWLKTGNAGVLATDYLGTQNNTPLNFKVFAQNSGIVSSAGPTFLGYQAGNVNTATNNSGFGFQALLVNTTGFGNTAHGYYTLRSNTTGTYNVAMGHYALWKNTTASHNIGIGVNSLYDNTTGAGNVAVGSNSLTFNISGGTNAAIGYAAMYSNLTGQWNAAAGGNALYSNTSGELNSAMGPAALSNNTTGNRNSGLGYGAATSVGTLNSATAIGELAIVNANDKVRLGSPTVTVIEGQVAYTFPSDGRFKTNVTEEVQGLDFITRLRPVVYNFDTRKFTEFLTKNMTDSLRNIHLAGVDYAPSTAVRQSGFIAQEVEKIAQEIGYDFNGVHAPVDENDNYSVAYSQFVMPLVKSVQELNATNIALQARLDAQEALIQKLLAQNGATDPASKSDAPSLGQNAPNPAHGETTVQYYVPAAMTCNSGKCMIALHDASGRRLQTVPVKAGHGSITLQLGSLSDGIYSYQLIVNDAVVASQKLMVSK